MAEEYRVVGESSTEGTAGAEVLDWLIWGYEPTTDLALAKRAAADRRGRGDRNVKVERRAGPSAPWEAVADEEKGASK